MPDSLDRSLDAIARHPYLQIPTGRELSPAERACVVDVICRWIERDVERFRR